MSLTDAPLTSHQAARTSPAIGSGVVRNTWPRSATWSITDNVTSSFPPTLLTVGNADPLRPHSELLVERLRAAGVEVETLFFPDGHEPPLGHEYQFDLDSDAGHLFLERLLAFLGGRLADP